MNADRHATALPCSFAAQKNLKLALRFGLICPHPLPQEMGSLMNQYTLLKG
jgi:hypothetical protein